MMMNRNPLSLFMMACAFALALGHQLIPHQHDGDDRHLWAHQHPEFLHYGSDGARQDQDDQSESGTFVTFVSIFLQGKTICCVQSLYPSELTDRGIMYTASLYHHFEAEIDLAHQRHGIYRSRSSTLLPDAVLHTLPLGLRAPPSFYSHRS